ncbi:hypothetical protein EYZ11_010986 [Aspergillus tanneri]|uniref:Amino acid permease/ SLC12A domain-containing protein n=1 Tax=Aspergillus tanneri TaxID=1220188 RepID=A0A4S3J4J6_9EURO|nr:hypothetical protein EYZ11_010986 [Aspergillus tanneri]
MEQNKPHKVLKDRYLSLIIIGGAVSTGLLVGSIIGIVAFMVLSALGEMSSFAPMPCGLGGYASRFVDPALGFATGYCYALRYMLSTPNNLVAASLLMTFWVRNNVDPSVFITVALLVVLFINLISVKGFVLGGGPKYWKSPGAFAESPIEGAGGAFARAWTTMVHAIYAYGGTELVRAPLAESKNPRTAMAGSLRFTFFRIFSIYILSIFFLGLVVPYNSPKLAFSSDSKTSAAASPFVAAMKLAKIGGLAHVINACMLIFVVATATTDFYLATRTIYGIAVDGKAPAFLARTNKRGTPILAAVAPFLFCMLAYISIRTGSMPVFKYLTQVVVGFNVLSWISILTTHIAFCRAVKSQNIPSDRFPCRAAFRVWGSIAALVFLCIFILIKGAEVFIQDFDYGVLVVLYIDIPVYLVFIFGYKICYKTHRVRPTEADLTTGVSPVPFEEERAQKEAEDKVKIANAVGIKRVYRRFLALFY